MLFTVLILSIVVNVVITIILLKIYTDIQWKFIADFEKRVDKKLNLSSLLWDDSIDK